MTAVVCKRSDCSNLVKPPRRGYCSDRCMKTVNMRRYRQSRKKASDDQVKAVNWPRRLDTRDAQGRTQARRPPPWFVDEQWPARIDAEGLSFEEVADLCGTTRPTISRWVAWLQANSADALRRQGIRDNVPAGILDDFIAFRDRYFRLPGNKPFITAGFHLRWVDAILNVIEHGGEQVILSPPRHGKTELLVHVACWLICRNPDIRMIWVGGNEDIAANAVGLVQQELTSNERLVDEHGPFQPAARTGKKWTASEFTVATRRAQQKSPTMVAVGRGGKLASRDADLIVCDDIEDDKTTAQPASREATRRWWAKEVSTRQEEHTAWFVIGSREDPDDLYNHLLENEEWRDKFIVETAHADWCDKPLADEDTHDGCVLFPQLRTFPYLMKKRRQIGDALFEMKYLNRPRPEGMAYFAREALEECLDRSRTIGQVPPNCRLIAGLDPAPKGYQAAVLWAVNVKTGDRFLVDISNELAGGTPHLRWILADWSARYGFTDWVVESNYADDKLTTDPEIVDIRRRLNLRIVSFHTGNNKNDRFVLGVTAQTPLYENGQVNLPYGDPQTRAKVDVFVAQHVNWRPTAGRQGHKHWKTDVVMAAWLPHDEILSWQRHMVAEMAVEFQTSGGWLWNYGAQR